MKNIYKIIFLTIGLAIYFESANAQSNFETNSDSLSLDKNIKIGRLPNGITYYLKSIKEPQPKLYMDFLVKAGTNNQEKNQLNIAHALEHMAFRTSESFQYGIYKETKELNKAGIRKLKDLNGHTSYYYTTYNYSIPLDAKRKEAINIGIKWFRDIAAGLKLRNDEINKERDILKEEFILSHGKDYNRTNAKSTLDSKLYPCRKSIVNFFSHNKTFPTESLKHFYHDWYRPELMAISVVGDFDPNAMEKRIRKEFYGVKQPKESISFSSCDSLFYYGQNRFAVVESNIDQLGTITDKSVEYKLLFRDHKTKNSISKWEGLKRLMIWKLIVEILNKRFEEASQKYCSSYTIFSKYHNFGEPYALEITINSDNNLEQKALKETVKIMRQIKKYGVYKSEWEEAKDKILNIPNSPILNNASYWRNEILKHYVIGEALPTKKEEHLKNWLAELSHAKFNDIAEHFIEEMPEDIGIIAPSGHKALSYNIKQIRSSIMDIYSNPIQNYELYQTPKYLINPEKEIKWEKKKYQDKGIGPSGSLELQLANGVKVVLKSYKPKGILKDKILLHGFSLKGASCFSKNDYFSAMLAPHIIKNSGAGHLDKFQLKRYLSSNNQQLLSRCQVSPYIGYLESGVSGEATLDGLEDMFRLVYLYFTSPRKDKLAFEDWKLEEYELYLNSPTKVVDADFRNSIREITRDNSVKKGPLGAATRNLKGTKRFDGIKEVSWNKAYRIYKDIFGNAEGFTFLISGEFELDSITSLVNKYLGNLPNIKRFRCVSEPTKTVASPITHLNNKISKPKYYKMDNTYYGVRFFYYNNNKMDDWREQIKVRILGMIANQKAWNLRFDKNYGLYLISGFGKFNRNMSRYEIGLNFSCSEEDLTSIKKESRRIISEIKSGKIEKEFKPAVKSILLKSIYSNSRANQPWALRERLYEHFRYQRPWVTSSEFENFVKSINSNDIIEVANKYLGEEKFYEFVMRE